MLYKSDKNSNILLYIGELSKTPYSKTVRCRKLTNPVTGVSYYPDLIFRSDYRLADITDHEAYTEIASDKSYTPDRVLIFYAVPEDTEAIIAYANRISKIIETEEKSHTFLFSEDDVKEMDRFRNTFPLTFHTNEEFTGICRYIKSTGEIEATVNAFFKAHVIPSKVTKKEALTALSGFKDLALSTVGKTKTPVREQPDRSCYAPFFSNVYAESDVLPLLKDTENVIEIGHYKDIFNRANQCFYMQKKSPSLIYAKNTGNKIYPGAPFCQSFGNEHFYYASTVMNCMYDCSYCYLRGVYPSAHVVAYMNLDDYFSEVDGLLKKHPVYLCISYDTDLLALENMLHMCEAWMEFAKSRKDLTIEIRTKSGNPDIFKKFADGTERPNVIFAWTLSPDEVAGFAEQNLPSLKARISAMKAASEKNYKVRICFDPMIYHAGWRESYSNMLSELFLTYPPENVYDASIGIFRVSNEYMKKMRKKDPCNPVSLFPYETVGGACHYGLLSVTMVEYLKQELIKYIPENKIYTWTGKEE